MTSFEVPVSCAGKIFEQQKFWLLEGYGPGLSCGRTVTRDLRIGNMAEWLRRQTRNLVGIALVGSNPAVVELTFFFVSGG